MAGMRNMHKLYVCIIWNTDVGCTLRYIGGEEEGGKNGRSERKNTKLPIYVELDFTRPML